MQVGSSFSGLVNTVPGKKKVAGSVLNPSTGLNLDLLKMDIYKMDMEKDPLFRGEFDVVKQLISERPEMVAAKKRVRNRKLIFLKHMAEAAIMRSSATYFSV